MKARKKVPEYRSAAQPSRFEAAWSRSGGSPFEEPAVATALGVGVVLALCKNLSLIEKHSL
jgi:hypothetical protein